jgi:acylphosphatase
VQGVGFRYTVQNLALQYDVHGFVKNLPDGRVELVLEGPAPEVESLIDALKQKMSGFIRKADIAEQPATGELRGFAIRH